MSQFKFHFFKNQHYIDLYPIQFGQEVCQPLHSFGPSLKEHYLFHYIISGKGIFYDTEAQKEYVLSAGQGFLIPPNVICSYEADQDDPWAYAWVEFNGLKAAHFLQQAGLGKKQKIFSQRVTATDSPVYKEMMAILENYESRSSKIIGHLYHFLDALIDSSLEKKELIYDDTKELYIREAIHFIERNYSSSISIDEIADFCNLNRSYFSRLFKEQMSISPQQFLIQYRLSQACELLKEGQLSLSEIAEAVGYSNQFNFSAAFKRQYKLSPAKWRKQYPF